MTERAEDPKTPVPIYTEQDGYLEIRFAEPRSFADVVSQGQEMIRHCQDRKPPRLLIDMCLLRMKLSTLERYEMGIIGSGLAPHVKKVAVLARAEFIDPQKFGVQVAINRGLASDIFSDRAAAVAWLKQP